MRVRRAVAVVAGAALAAAAGWGMARTIDGATTGRSGAGRPDAARTSRGLGALLYVRGRTLRRMPLDGGAGESLGRWRADLGVASPDGRWIAEVVARRGAPGRERDFVAAPELVVEEVATGRAISAGAGFAPQWSGGSLVFLRPTRPRICSSESCAGAWEVVSFTPGAGRRAVMLGPGRWSLLGSLGRSVLVADPRDLSRTLLVSPGRAPRSLDVAPSQVWAGAPDGSRLVVARRGAARIARVRDGAPAASRRVAVKGRLAEGAWAPDSRHAAAVVLGRSGARLVTIAANGSVAPFRGTRGAAGPVLWSSDGRAVIATRDRGIRRVVIVCDAGERSCRPLFSYVEDVTLLGVAG